MKRKQDRAEKNTEENRRNWEKNSFFKFQGEEKLKKGKKEKISDVQELSAQSPRFALGSKSSKDTSEELQNRRKETVCYIIRNVIKLSLNRRIIESWKKFLSYLHSQEPHGVNEY